MGLLGGVGSGKSTVARRAAECYGLTVVDADAAGHRALTTDDVKMRLRERFGDGIFDAGGAVDRSALAARVFGQAADRQAARKVLEQITHPAITAELERQIEQARTTGVAALLLDAAVLLEAGWQRLCDAIIYIDVPAEVRSARVAASRGWSESQWRDREASQLTLDEKRRRADAVIDNRGTPDEAAHELAAALETVCGIRLPEPAHVAGVSAP